MAVGYGTTPEEMRRAAAHVLKVNEEVQAQLAGLRNQLTPLAGAWRGEASAAFHNLMARWDSDAHALNEALRGIGEAIANSGQQYEAAEQEQSRNLSVIRGALG